MRGVTCCLLFAAFFLLSNVTAFIDRALINTGKSLKKLALPDLQGSKLPRPRSDPVTLSATMEEKPFVVQEATKVASRRWTKATKQLATLGPASCTYEMIEKLFLAGADVFRLNFSHGKHEEKAELVDIIRSIEEKWDHPIAILADLQGPKLRVGVFEHDKVELVDGQKFRFDLDPELGDSCRVQLPHPEIISSLSVGDVLLLDDGKLRMNIEKAGDDFVECIVEIGGTLSNRKGVNCPTIIIPISALTEKDKKDLDFALSINVDWVALSFVQKPEDMMEIKEIVGNKAKVMAKLEKPQAVEPQSVMDEIIGLSDGIMVARGDLGVEMFPEDVPIIQKRIIDTCRRLGKPVVVATQMLESMITAPTPTRAEASDVATAIYDGADAVMLSAESAAGKYPVESVLMQQRIINRVESDAAYRSSLDRNKIGGDEKSATDAVTKAAKQISDTIDAKAIVVFTRTGSTVIRASKLRPSVPIMGVSPNIRAARNLALVWGVYPATATEEDILPTEKSVLKSMIAKSCNIAMEKKICSDPTDLLVFTAGLPFGISGVANVIRIVPAIGPDAWDPTLTEGPEAVGQESFVNWDHDM
mmetsp:Transcript_16036/g.21192  ORF Transcript_16036/g.21192 Transcript_16036/m.21192 type:complete len:588 (+) Transcript_16036:184-1947(+)|eukprot:CAMPEP_0117750640 /NCGR_PEP_ID=MMETSP0947-20121206/10494_1 /TAXON_ID=44440 /ORGANISM="Chattonella subsalsa, Strain CCMP2191" /LENGTH=587 /DNA_ID=CAMNT_0005568857 /DNA_START=176 /DNA_END=1939 /DNA_ORIENTATION=-